MKAVPRLHPEDVWRPPTEWQEPPQLSRGLQPSAALVSTGRQWNSPMTLKDGRATLRSMVWAQLDSCTEGSGTEPTELLRFLGRLKSQQKQQKGSSP